MKKRLLMFLPILFLILTAACDPLPAQLTGEKEDGGDYGFLGDTMSSIFFDFTVTEAVSCDSYQGYAPASGAKLIAATVTVHNTFTKTLPMGYYDFQIQWGEGEQDFGYPIPAWCELQFPDEYELAIDESRTAVLVYEVPEDTTDYSISYLEVYDNNETGDSYFIYFSAAHDQSSKEVV